MDHKGVILSLAYGHNTLLCIDENQFTSKTGEPTRSNRLDLYFPRHCLYSPVRSFLVGPVEILSLVNLSGIQRYLHDGKGVWLPIRPSSS